MKVNVKRNHESKCLKETMKVNVKKNHESKC